MTDDAEIYENHILRHFDEPFHRGRLDDATHRARVDNPDCGDSVRFELRVNSDGVILQAWFSAAGCVISQASASMLAEFAEGRNVVEVGQMTPQAMLAIFRAQLTSRRQQCCLLALKAMLATIGSPTGPSDRDDW